MVKAGTWVLLTVLSAVILKEWIHSNKLLIVLVAFSYNLKSEQSKYSEESVLLVLHQNKSYLLLLESFQWMIPLSIHNKFSGQK